MSHELSPSQLEDLQEVLTPGAIMAALLLGYLPSMTLADAHRIFSEGRLKGRRESCALVVPEGFVLVPVEQRAELNDGRFLFAFIAGLHKEIPEDGAPTGWSDFSDDQRKRLERAWTEMISEAAAPRPQDRGSEG